MSKEIYFEAVYSQIPRLLSLLDRNTGSPTFGCFDRNYWHYRIIDFPCARSQEAVLTLALLYNLRDSRNNYYNNRVILEWIKACLKFWCSIQAKNGSFSEWYINENSFVATAFSAYAVSETLLEVKDELDERALFLDHLKKSGDWLSSKFESRVVNQAAGAAIALYNIYLLTNSEKYLAASREKIEFLNKSQNKEGWFMEYGGADIGYLSLTIDYLAKLYQKTQDKKIFEILEKAILFISDFMHPDFTFGGSYSSRNTDYIIPSGFEIMAKFSPRNKAMAGIVREAIKEKTTVIPQALDDRYLTYLAYNYLQAYETAVDYKFEIDKFPESVSGYPNLGIKVIRRKDFYLAFNFKKGGTFKIVFSNNRSLEDWGIILEAQNGKNYSSGSMGSDAKILEDSPASLIVDSNFKKIDKAVLSTSKLVVLRIFQLTLGLFEGIGFWLKNKLRDNLITKAGNTPLKLNRHLEIGQEKLIITDNIDGTQNIKSVIVNAKFSYIFVPSSCYFQPSDLDHATFVYDLKNQRNRLKIVREYDFKGNLINTSYE